jgi:hypothetical protein
MLSWSCCLSGASEASVKSANGAARPWQGGRRTRPARHMTRRLHTKRRAQQVPGLSGQHERCNNACWDAAPTRFQPGAHGPERRSAGDWGEKGARPLADGPERCGGRFSLSGSDWVGRSGPLRKWNLYIF